MEIRKNNTYSKKRWNIQTHSHFTFFSKVFEKIVNKQMINFLNANSLLSLLQSGFRSNHSCTSALIKAAEDIRTHLDSNEISVLVLLDHLKAFDTVDHHCIIYLKLCTFFNFTKKAVSLINSYLTMRFQSVAGNNSCSKTLHTSRGAPKDLFLDLFYIRYTVKICLIK